MLRRIVRSFSKTFRHRSTGANRSEANVSQGVRDSFWLQGMQAGLKNAFDCIKVFSETDHTADLEKFDIPTLIIHGDDDQIVPISAAAMLSSKLVKGSILKVYKGARVRPHVHPQGPAYADLLEFLKSLEN